MKLPIFLITLLLASQVQAKTLRIGVVDSGLNLSDSRFSKYLCKTGHKDFTGEGITDKEGHGTAIVGLIQEYAKKGNYCLVIYKYYSSSNTDGTNLTNEVKALQQAAKDGVKIINLSSSGSGFNEGEYLTIRDNPQIVFVVAAGNQGLNLDIPENTAYPASYFLENEIVVSDVNVDFTKSPYSNYSKKINVFEVGDNIAVDVPNGYEVMSGTSISTAIHTGKMIREILDANK